ncbi:hypothetical protein JL722_5132 [Aureococcus anophagefferens]|nr:hypothetical protein JL722_5132 [Aureococcus anophagefferens]
MAANLSVKELKAQLRERGVDPVAVLSCSEKSELVALLRDAAPKQAAPPSPRRAAPPSSSGCPFREQHSSGVGATMSVRELKAALKARATRRPAAPKSGARAVPKADADLRRRLEPDGVAVALGHHLMNTALTGRAYPARITADMLWPIGGQRGFVNIFEEHYKRLFGDPRMNVLFGHRNPELPPAEHGRRLGLYVLEQNGLSGDYSAGAHDTFSVAHQNAKSCPRRPKRHRDAMAFTVQQRDAWLGHLAQACDARCVNLATKTEILAWAVGNMATYGPFIQDTRAAALVAALPTLLALSARRAPFSARRAPRQRTLMSAALRRAAELPGRHPRRRPQGCAAAYYLKERGFDDVTVVERTAVAAAASGKGGGFL